MDRDKKYETHPSFGMISFSRIHSGGKGPRLFQSFTDNSTFISCKIKGAEVGHDLGRDWVHGNKTMIEVYISASQFAELLTSMNIGDGVPCTIKQVAGVEIPKAPLCETVASKVRNTFKNEVKDKINDLQKVAKEIETMLAGSKLSKENQKQLNWKIQELAGLFSDHAPFMLDSFEEAVEKTVVGAKAECDAWLTHNIMRAGLESLLNQAPSLSNNSNPALECKDDIAHGLSQDSIEKIMGWE
jgi:hypothetical protein